MLLLAVLSEIPGRIRVHVPDRAEGRSLGTAAYRRLVQRLLQFPGVRDAEANPLTGNVLIVFDPHRIGRERLMEQIRSGSWQTPNEFDEEPEEESLPPVLYDRPAGSVQRARIAVRGLDRDPHFARRVVQELEKHPGVRAKAIPLTGHVLVERESDAAPLSQLVAEAAELEPPPLPNEERPEHPLDPAPLMQAVLRTAGAALGLTSIAVQTLLGVRGRPKGANTAANVAAVVGLLRSFPALREGLRRALGYNMADATFALAAITSLTAARSPLGLAVMGVESYVLLRQVLACRANWQQYEQHHGVAPELKPDTAVRLEPGDRVPVRAGVLEGTGTAIHRDGLPFPVRPGVEVFSGALLAGGPFVVQLKEEEDFVPQVRPSPPAPGLWSRYLRVLGPASFAYAGMIGLTTRSLADTFNALLLVNPRTALGGTEAANFDAVTRVSRQGVVVVGSRHERVIRRPDLLLLDGARVLTDGLELSRVLPLAEDRESNELLELASKVSLAAGSPWGKAFARNNGTKVLEGEFDGYRAAAVLDGTTYCLQTVENDGIHPSAQKLRNRGEYLLLLTGDDQPLALLSLRHRLAGGLDDLVETADRQGVRLGIVPSGDSAAEQALSHRTEIPLVVSSDAVAMIRKAQQRGASVAFVSDSTAAAEALADCDLAIGLAAGRQSFPARVDLLTPDLSGVAAILEAGARRDAAVRDAVLFSAASNVFGAVWGFWARPGVERASLPVYLGLLSAVSDGLIRLAGGRRARTSLGYLVDPHPERWGLRTIDEVLHAFDASADGLTGDQAARRRQRIVHGSRGSELLKAVLDQFRYPTTGILAGAAVLSLILDRKFDFSIILTTIGVNVAVGAWQERQVNQTAETLRKLATVTARVLRDGRPQTLPANELVLGDVLLLEPGDRVAADARLISSRGLEVDEAALTGESFPVAKWAENGSPETQIVLDGSDVVVGTGAGVVVAVGRQTRMGTLAAALELDETEQSPLGVRLGRLLWQSLPLTTAASAVVVVSGLLRRQPLAPQMLVGASMALAAVPEGLPLLAGLGQGGVARRLARLNALVRRVAAVEALGRVDVACADKTGTMTEGRLELSLVADAEDEAALPGELAEPLGRVLLTAAYASPHPDEAGASAHPTDVAVVRGAARAGLEEQLQRRRDHESPFDPSQAFHATVVERRLCVKGAPEVVLRRCTRLRRGGRDEPLDNAGRDALIERSRRFAEQGLRVLAVAEAPGREINEESIDDPHELTALGFLGIRDPLRPTVRAAVQRCQAAGVRVIMITGDHPATARNIAAEAGLPVDDGAILTGGELAELDDEELAQRLERASVVARATPLDKLQIIGCLQHRGHTVAMTGDGVNDAPALRLANVGVAMGRAGTEVARQAADIVLADDDFATLVEALVEGRGFWRNMRRALGLLLGGNLGELGLIAGASVLGYPNPMNPPQILVVNLITDVLPALAVVLQRPEHRHLPGLAREGLSAMDRSLRTDVFRRALLTSGPSLAAYLFSYRADDPAQANTIAFSTIVCNQLAQTYEAGRFNGHLSRPVIGAIAASAGLLGTTLLTPPLRRRLGLTIPTPFSCAVIGASALCAGAFSGIEPAGEDGGESDE